MVHDETIADDAPAGPRLSFGCKILAFIAQAAGSIKERGCPSGPIKSTIIIISSTKT